MSHFSFADIQRAARAETYWRNVLADTPPMLFLPPDNGLMAGNAIQPQELPLTLAPDVTARLLKISKNKELPLFLLLLTALQSLLGRYSGTRDDTWRGLIATPPCQPVGPASDGLVLLPLEIRPADSFKQALLHIREQALKAYQEQDFGLYALVQSLVSKNSQAGLAEVACWLENLHEAELPLSSALRLIFRRDGTQLQGRLEFDTSRFSSDTLTRFVRHYQILLAQALQEMDRPLQELSLLSGDEKKQISRFARPVVEARPSTSLVDRFEDQVRQRPQQLAIVTDRKSWTYQELHQQVNAITAVLQPMIRSNVTLPTSPFKKNGETLRVGLLLDRSAWVVAAVWGTLKAGAVLVPLEASLPVERLQFMLTDSQCDVLLVETQTAGRLPEVIADSELPLINVETLSSPAEAPPTIMPPADHTAYIIYTSGSTGRPKGVAVPYSALNNMVHNVQQVVYEPLDGPLREAMSAPVSFDVGLKQMLTPVVWGHTLVLLNDEVRRDARLYLNSLTDHSVSVINITPSFFGALLESGLAENPPPALRHIMVGSEALPWSLVHEFYARPITAAISMHNFYGPTEACVEVTGLRIDPRQMRSAGSVPIGYPLPNCEVLILDAALNPQPVGVPGDIWLGGVNLARGYVNAPDVTRQRFIAHPRQPEQRLYLTGDRGRWLADGTIEYLGRNDQQIKLRGYRVEPGEIVAHLLQHDQVREAVVAARTAHQTEEPELVAWVTPREPYSAPDIPALRQYLASLLPEYMIPAHFVVLPALPLTSSGKVDLQGLPLPEVLTRPASVTEQPRTPLEANLAALWREVLEVPNPGRHDNFFELGGHSIRATRLASRIHRHLGLDIRLWDIFTYPTIASLAEQIQSSPSAGMPKLQPLPPAATYAISHAQKRLWIFEQIHGASPVYNIAGTFMLQGPFDPERFQQALQAVVQRHESLRTDFITVGGEPRQRIHTELAFQAEVVNLEGQNDQEPQVQSIARRICQTAFDIHQAPLLRAGLIRCAPDRFAISLALHHIICDAWSINLLTEELFRLYHIMVSGVRDQESGGKMQADSDTASTDALSPLVIQYKEYAAWETNLLTGSEGHRLKQFWMEHLQNLPPNLEVAPDFPRPPIKTYAGDTVSRVLETSRHTALENLVRTHQASLFMGLIALVKILLYHHTTRTELHLGVSMAGRIHPDLEKQIGFFINMLPLRTIIPVDGTYSDLLQRVKNGATEVYAHQSYPFDRLVDDLGHSRDLSRLPLFDIAIDFENAENFQEVLPNIEVQELSSGLPYCKYDLLFVFIESPQHLTLALEYNTDLYQRTTAITLLEQLDDLIRQVLEHPQRRICDLVLSGEMVAAGPQVVTQFNF